MFLQNDENYQVIINVNSGIMKLVFIAIVGGFLHIQFDIMLREKLMTNDAQLTFNFTKLEHELAQRCDELWQRLDNKTFTQLKSDTLEELWLQTCTSFTSLEGIQKNLPNLKSLTLLGLVNLNDIVNVLKSAPHKITPFSLNNGTDKNT